nr:aldehyde ferredoxin oxidoreductase family protein [Candidatus Sigynarchaeota archaeon]
MAGYNGKILWVDLTTRTLTEESPSDDVYRKYLGGYGLGVYYLYKAMKPRCDPLGPENMLGFIPGFFTGSAAPLTGRCAVCGKSPQTGGWNDSSIGGYIGAAIKKAGFDAIFVKGASKTPVYLHVDDAKKEILDAKDLWGLDTVATEAWLKEKHGTSIRSCEIGKAGENLLTYAAIISEFRAAARGGMGTVMGSKKLKAICFNGSKKIDYADAQAITSLVKDYNQKINKNASDFGAILASNMAPKMGGLVRTFKIEMAQNHAIACRIFKNGGTSTATSVQVAVGDTPVKNFTGTYLDYPMKVVQNFVYEHFEEKGWITGHQGCFSCPVQCGNVMKVPELNLDRCQRPEYEALASLGAVLLNGDVLKAIEANDFINRAGIDVISTGAVVAFTIECCESGNLTKKDFECKAFPEGFLPGWNTPEWIMPLLNLIVNREGIGDLLARGVKEASKAIDKGSEDFAMAINGQEIPMHDPRKFAGLTTTYIADPTPGRHTAASLEFQAMGQLNDFVDGVKFNLNKKKRVEGGEHARFSMFVQTCNALGLCQFALTFEKYPMLAMFKAIAGWDMKPEDLFTIGHRIQVLRHLFNAREGAVKFEVPKRALGIPPMSKGPLANITIKPEANIKAYFKGLGLDETGVPVRETLEKLGLDFCIGDLSKVKGAPVPPFT